MKKTPKIIQNLSSEQFMELKRVINDPFFFSEFIYVINSMFGRTQFKLYPYQKAVLWEFLTKRFNIILKFRQAGLTELIAMYALWLAMYHPEKNILIISIKERVAKRLLKKIKYMYRNLPEHLKTPVINGRGEDIGTACVTLDTVLIGNKKNFKIGEIIPALPGILDVQHLDLQVLTHKGTFERVTKTINKGTLQTWEIVNDKGKILKCTPKHRLYTTKGWKTVKEVLEKNLNCIFKDYDFLQEVSSPITEKPKKEIIKETKLKGYYVSNWGRVFNKDLKRLKTRISGHERIKLKGSGGDKFYSVHRLVWETFNSPIPENFIVDHVDCVRTHNWLSNLQCITYSENTKRAYKFSRSLICNNYVHDKISLRKLGKIKELTLKYGNSYGSGRIIGDKLGLSTKRISLYRNSKTCNNTYISKIKLVNITREVICDLEVENNHSYITESHYINHNTELEFSNGSLITSVPTTEDAGRSEALSLLIIDEAAIVKWANTIWAAAFPTLSTGGSAILNSTPYGVGNFFHKTWVDSCAKGNNFNPIRLRWQMHPDRDIHWYNEQRLILGPRRTAQEIDGDFLTSGNNVFDLLDIRAIEDMLDEYTLYDTKNDARFNKLTTFNGQLQIFGPPIKGETYFLGSDIATGRARDYSSLTLMDKHGEEHAVFKGKIPINAHTKLLGDLGKIYNWAHLAPEANDIGLGVAMKLSEQGYRNLYYSKKLLREKGMNKPKEEKIPGWYTTKRNRPVIIGGLEEDIRLNNIIIKDRAFVNEAYTFIYDNENKPVAMGKGGSNSEEEMDGEEYTDDAILGKSITNHIRKGKVNSINVMPK